MKDFLLTCLIVFIMFVLATSIIILYVLDHAL